MPISNQEAMQGLISNKPAGQFVKDLCREHHMGEAKFNYWNSKLKKEQTSFVPRDTTGFIRLKVKGPVGEGLPLARITFNSGNSITVFNPVVFNILGHLL